MTKVKEIILVIRRPRLLHDVYDVILVRGEHEGVQRMCIRHKLSNDTIPDGQDSSGPACPAHTGPLSNRPHLPRTRWPEAARNTPGLRDTRVPVPSLAPWRGDAMSAASGPSPRGTFDGRIRITSAAPSCRVGANSTCSRHFRKDAYNVIVPNKKAPGAYAHESEQDSQQPLPLCLLPSNSITDWATYFFLERCLQQQQR